MFNDKQHHAQRSITVNPIIPLLPKNIMITWPEDIKLPKPNVFTRFRILPKVTKYHRQTHNGGKFLPNFSTKFG